MTALALCYTHLLQPELLGAGLGSAECMNSPARNVPEVPSTLLGAVVRFGVFEFHPKSGELLKQGRRVRLSGQPAQILALLLRCPAELVTREELRQALWPADTHVNFDQSLNAAVKRLRHALGDSPEKPVFIETMARRGYRFIAPAGAPGPSSPPSAGIVQAVHSIAVLPFENATTDPDADYLVDGLTEAVINALSRLPALRVLARSTVFRYRGKLVDCRALGRKLSVDAVLLGRVSQRGDQLMIGTELVEVGTGWLIWGEQFSRDFADVHLIEAELSAKISERLRSELAGKTNASAPVGRRTQSTEAYQDYLKGRYHWNRMSAEGLQKSVEYFQHALQKDPDFALAHAGLADAYCLLGFFDLVPPAEAMPKAKESAMRAVEIDGGLAEAYASLASILKVYDHDWLAAEHRYQQALRLNPNYVHAYRGYAALLAALGRFSESVLQIRHAQELDPLSVVVSMEMAWNFFIAREYDRAIEQALRVTHFDSEFPSAKYILGLAYEQKGKFGEARAALEQSLAAAPGHAAGTASLGHLFGITGQREQALRMLDQLNRLASGGYVAPFWHSILYAGLGDVDAAIDHLERSFVQSDVWLVWLNSDPRLDKLRADPRFHQLLRRVGFGGQVAGA
jgi:TolB-like protein/Tfp pilus assembly protein PilF